MEWVDACLEPEIGSERVLKDGPYGMVALREGDELSVYRVDGTVGWRGVLRLSWWAERPLGLPVGWERWFDQRARATLWRRGVRPWWRRHALRPMHVTPNRDRPPWLRAP